MTRRRLPWLILFLAGLAYELYAWLNGAPGDTLSEVVWDIWDACPLAFAPLFLVLGHWFWPRITRHGFPVSERVAKGDKKKE